MAFEEEAERDVGVSVRRLSGVEPVAWDVAVREGAPLAESAVHLVGLLVGQPADSN